MVEQVTDVAAGHLIGHRGAATAVGGRIDLFARAVTDLANLVTGIDNYFYELYNSITDARDSELAKAICTASCRN